MPPPLVRHRIAPEPRPVAGDPTPPPQCVDSSTLIVADLATRKLDTLGRLATGTIWKGSIGSRGLFPYFDGFAVMHDGSLAILRGREYRAEWVSADRTHTTTPRLTYGWRRVDDAERARLGDSINAVRKTLYEANVAKWIKDSTAVGGAGPTQTVTGVFTATGLPTPPLQLPNRKPLPPPALDLQEIPDFLPPTGVDPVYADGDNKYVDPYPSACRGRHQRWTSTTSSIGKARSSTGSPLPQGVRSPALPRVLCFSSHETRG